MLGCLLTEITGSTADDIVAGLRIYDGEVDMPAGAMEAIEQCIRLMVPVEGYVIRAKIQCSMSHTGAPSNFAVVLSHVDESSPDEAAEVGYTDTMLPRGAVVH